MYAPECHSCAVVSSSTAVAAADVASATETRCGTSTGVVVLVATEKPFSPTAVQAMLDDELRRAAADADAIIVRSDKVTAPLIRDAHRLKLVVRAGTGVETIDIKACTAAGIVVMNTPGQNSTAVAELCFGQMLTLARGWWMGNPGTELRGKTIGLIKYGYIAKRMRAIARGFGMTVMAYDPYIDHTVLVEDGVICAESMEQLFSLCDYVSIHTPHTRVTFSLLSMMKFGATLVNSTRHEAVDQDAVTRMLEIRPDFKFAADVPPGNFRYLEQHYNQRVCFSAIKMGAQTEEANFACGVAALTQVVNFFMKNDRCHQMFE